jgi:hypothetical protein
VCLDYDEIRNIVVQVLEQKAYCQQDPDQDEDEEAPEDQAEYDTVLIASAGDVVASLATALGPDFAPAFPEFFRLLAKFYVSIPGKICGSLNLLFIAEKEAFPQRAFICHRLSR